MHVFRHLAGDFIDLLRDSYLPALLGLTETEQYVLERLESV